MTTPTRLPALFADHPAAAELPGKSLWQETRFRALALAVTMFAFNVPGDGLREALGPRLRGTQR